MYNSLEMCKEWDKHPTAMQSPFFPLLTPRDVNYLYNNVISYYIHGLAYYVVLRRQIFSELSGPGGSALIHYLLRCAQIGHPVDDHTLYAAEAALAAYNDGCESMPALPEYMVRELTTRTNSIHLPVPQSLVEAAHEAEERPHLSKNTREIPQVSAGAGEFDTNNELLTIKILANTVEKELEWLEEEGRISGSKAVRKPKKRLDEAFDDKGKDPVSRGGDPRKKQ